MVNFVLNEIVEAAEIMAGEAESILELLYEEAEATTEFLMEAAACMVHGFCGAMAEQNSGVAGAERFGQLWRGRSVGVLRLVTRNQAASVCAQDDGINWKRREQRCPTI